MSLRISIALAPLLLLSSCAFASAWTGPTGSPPNNNVAAPINTSSVGQVKSGSLGILGTLGVQTPSPNSGVGIDSYGNILLDQNTWGTTDALELNPNQVWNSGGGRALYLQWSNNGGGVIIGGQSGYTDSLTVANGSITAPQYCIGPSCITSWSSSALTGPYLPTYASWSSQGTGAGGAAIYNDNSGYKTLMIVGNSSAGGNREVKVWDDLTVSSNLTVGGNIFPSTQSNSGGGSWYFGSGAWGGSVGGVNSVTGLTYNGGSGSQLFTVSSGPGQASFQVDGSLFAGDNPLGWNPFGLDGSSDGDLALGGNAEIAGALDVQGPGTFNQSVTVRDTVLGDGVYNGWWSGCFGSDCEGGSADQYGVYANGSVWAAQFNGNEDVNGNVQASAFYYDSDIRLKKNIAAIASSTALADVLALQPVTFDWKNVSMGTGQQIGFIAQQVQTVVPQLVNTNATTGYEEVDYARMAPLLVGSVQDLDQKLEDQQTQIDAQQSQITAQQADINTQQHEIDNLGADIQALEAK
jgi:Chaperone of endosialidase